MTTLKKIFTWKVWMLLIFIILAVFAISPNFEKIGVQVKTVTGISSDQGIKVGDVIRVFNGETITNVVQFNELLLNSSSIEEKNITVETDKDKVSYTITSDIGFTVDSIDKDNVTEIIIKGVTEGFNLTEGAILLAVNDEKITEEKTFYDIKNNSLL